MTMSVSAVVNAEEQQDLACPVDQCVWDPEMDDYDPWANDDPTTSGRANDSEGQVRLPNHQPGSVTHLDAEGFACIPSQNPIVTSIADAIGRDDDRGKDNSQTESTGYVSTLNPEAEPFRPDMGRGTGGNEVMREATDGSNGPARGWTYAGNQGRMLSEEVLAKIGFNRSAAQAKQAAKRKAGISEAQAERMRISRETAIARKEALKLMMPLCPPHRRNGTEISQNKTVSSCGLESESTQLSSSATDAKKTHHKHRGGKRRSGGKNDAKPNTIGIYFSNYNKNTPKARDYVNDRPEQVKCLVETHVEKDRIRWEMSKYIRGHNVTCAPARSTLDDKDNGNEGGTMVLGQKTINTQSLCEDTKVDGMPIHISELHNLAGRLVSTTGFDFLVLSGYARDGDIKELLDEVALVTRNGCIPFVLGADFNRSPQQVEAAAETRLLRAVVMTPTNAEATCHQGKGSMIDFFLVSDVLAQMVDSVLVARDVDPPWGPHDGLILTLDKKAIDIMVRELVVPERLPKRVTEEPSEEATWDSTPMANSNAQVENWSEEVKNSIVGQIGQAPHALATTLQLENFGKKLDKWLITKAGLDYDDDGNDKYKGRFTKPIVKTSLLNTRPRIGKSTTLANSGGLGLVASLWATARAICMKIRLAVVHKKPRTRMIYQGQLASIIGETHPTYTQAWKANCSDMFRRQAAVQILTVLNPEVTAEEAESAAAKFGSLTDIEYALDRATKKSEWEESVKKALEGGAGPAHAWTNKPNAISPEVKVKGKWVPQEIVDGEAEGWGTTWKRGDEDSYDRAIMALKAATAHAQGSKDDIERTKDMLTVRHVRAVAKGFGDGTAIGSDNTRFSEIADLPDEGISELIVIMKKIVDEVALPGQSMVHVMALLGKKTGGSRTIAICPTIYRLLMASIKQPVRDWDKAHGHSGDTALKGKIPALETMWRHLMLETGHALGRTNVMILWDVEKFFDSLDIDILIQECTEQEFPPVQLALGIQAHMADRILKAQGTLSEKLDRFGRSILAGCTLSTSFSRAYLLPVVAKTGLAEGHTLAQHVDDIEQVTTGTNLGRVKITAIRQARKLAKEIRSMKLVISTKSLVICNNTRMGRAIALILQRDNIPIKYSAAAVDLGVETAGGGRRVRNQQNVRIERSKRRALRIGKLSNITIKAHRLINTGVKAMRDYGALVGGVSPSDIAKHRRSNMLAFRKTGFQPCTATMHEWWMGGDKDPETAIRADQIQAWVGLWNKASSEEKVDFREAWRVILKIAAKAKVRWANASGPMSATICTLLDIGWIPLRPDYWEQRPGMEQREDPLTWPKMDFIDLSQVDEHGTQVREAFLPTLNKMKWSKASEHWLGEGLKEGNPNFEPVLKAKRYLMRKGLYDQARALDSIVCGACVTADRCPEMAGLVCKCGADDTAWHRFWGCPLLREETCDEISKTQHIIALIEKYALSETVWGRCILTQGYGRYTSEETSLGSQKSAATKNFDEIASCSKHNYTDGAGGSSRTPTELRKAGCAVAVIQHVGDVIENVGIKVSEIPGKQTVPRAELLAATMAAADFSSEEPHHTTFSDAMYVVKLAASGEAMPKDANKDLRKEFLRTNKEKRRVVKVKAHAEVQVLRGEIDIPTYIGNLCADVGAGAIADVLVNKVALEDVERMNKMVYWMAIRLSYIEARTIANLPEQIEGPVADPKSVPPLAQSEAKRIASGNHENMGHNVFWDDGWSRCSRCRRRRRPDNILFWATQPCEHGTEAAYLDGNEAGRSTIGPQHPARAGKGRGPDAAGKEDEPPKAKHRPPERNASHREKIDFLLGKSHPSESEDPKAGEVIIDDETRGWKSTKLGHSGAFPIGFNRDVPEMAPMTRQRAKRNTATWTANNKRTALNNRKAVNVAARSEVEDIINNEYDELPDFTGNVPFHVDASHDGIYCGGFVSCRKCGSTVAAGNKNNRIGKECDEGTSPWLTQAEMRNPKRKAEEEKEMDLVRPENNGKPCGKQRRPFQDLGRILIGRHPYGTKRKWPDGSVDPRPQRIDPRYCGIPGEPDRRAVIPMEQLGSQASDATFAARTTLTRKRPVDPRDEQHIGIPQRKRVHAALVDCQQKANLNNRRRVASEIIVREESEDIVQPVRRRIRGKQPQPANGER